MNIDFIKNNMLEMSDEVAVISEGKKYFFGEVYDEYKKIGQLLEDKGVEPGEVVALLADFTPVSMATMLVLVERDAIIVPISKTVKNKDFYLEISETEVLLDATGESLQITKTGVESTHPMLRSLKELSNPGLILFSSGTTGKPKAALHNLTFLMEKFRTRGKMLKTITFLLFDHIGGFNTLFHTLSSGGIIVTANRREPEEICQLIEKYHVELLPTSPTFLNMILLSHSYEKYDLSSLRMISYGTEPMPESTLTALHRIFPEVKLKQTYGLSEVGIMASKSEASDSLWMKIGGEGYETKIIDSILYIRSKSAMIGYLNAPSPFDKDGWFNTKDKVVVRGDYLKILGRTTDIVNIGGEKVYPIEVESKLLEMDEIQEVRVYGKEHPITGQILIAELLVDESNRNRDFLKRVRFFCSSNLEKFKIPAKFVFVDGEIIGDRFKKKR